MKIIKFKFKLEKGQVLPIIVLMIFAIIGMAALILDGGFIMSHRRAAQAAADAGAMAGAQRICAGTGDAVAVAEHYATVKNQASFASATVSGRQITVAATVQGDSFFAKIFGEDVLRASAEAVAGCFYPSRSNRMLPLAFYYESPPVSAGDADCLNQTCNLVNWDFKTLMEGLRSTPTTEMPFKDLYIIGETAKVCEKNVIGEVVCVDVKENELGGNRTWIDLGENIGKIMQSGLDYTIELPGWVTMESGTMSSGYRSALYEGMAKIPGYEDVNARLAFVPVYDKVCPNYPQINCAEDGDNFYLTQDNQRAYRLVGIAPFVVTCVTRGGDYEFGEYIPPNTDPNTSNKKMCPGYLMADLTSNNAIEGYFVEGIPVDSFTAGTGGVDVGIYIISLSK